MDGQAIITVSAATTALVQLLKWAIVPDKWGPIVVLSIAAFGVGLWAFSQGNFERNSLFDYFSGWVAVALSSAGTFGFTRAASTAVTATKAPPPGGAGSDRTV